VERPPQELMRGWVRSPIGKACKPDHGLGIQATSNLVKGSKKGSGVGKGRPVKSVETRVEVVSFEEGLKEEIEF
jgi:hypothetical protein